MPVEIRKIIGGLLLAALLAAQILMAQHMALHLDDDAQLPSTAIEAAHRPAIHGQAPYKQAAPAPLKNARAAAVAGHKNGDDDHCAVCFLVKFIFVIMAMALLVLVVPRFFSVRPVLLPERFTLGIFSAAYDACGPPLPA